MIYITQLICILKDQEKIFDEFESIAIPIISKYNGRLLFRVRPTAEIGIELNFPCWRKFVTCALDIQPCLVVVGIASEADHYLHSSARGTKGVLDVEILERPMSLEDYVFSY